jgi:hypothetical protein
MSSRHLIRLHDERDPPPWTGEGYNAKMFGEWMKRRWRADTGMTADGQVYDYETERARLTKAQADRTELEAAELRGDMVRAAWVIEEWSRMLGSLRSRMLSLPTKAAPRARGAPSDAEAAALLEREVLEALQELSDDGLDPRTRSRQERRAGRDAAASPVDGKRVGRRVSAPVAGKRGRARKVAD